MTTASTLDVEGVTVDFQGLRAIEKVTLYLEESMTFRLLSSDAAVPLVYPTAAPEVRSA